MGVTGTVLKNRYEIIAELGKGGMSTVYLARDNVLGSYWALKQVKNNINVDIEAFRKEVELLSSLNHADIPRIVDRIQINDDYFVVMDFIDGVSLGKKVVAEGPCSESDVIEWAKLLCGVLNYLHTVRDNPIVYRDMKPENIMLTQSGRVKLIDFGIAKECKRGQIQEGASIGTKGYAAPEQYSEGSNILDERTDIYSLGATLYYLLTAKSPGRPPNGMVPIRQVNQALSEGIEYIIGKCTENNPEDRYQNCLEVLEDLENIEQLNSQYKKMMQRRFFSFAGCFALSIVFFGLAVVGYGGIKKDKLDKYQLAYQNAIAYEKTAMDLDKKGVVEKNNQLYDDARKQYVKAGEQYRNAIKNKPGDIDAYLKLYNVLLPREGSKDTTAETQMAIDELRGYVDNVSSPMHDNPTLMYQLVKNCLDVSDGQNVYSQYALDYINKLKKTDAYKKGELNKNEIDTLAVISQYVANDISTQDFSNLSEALIKLESSITDSKSSPNDKLNNYFSIMKIYERYPSELKDAYVKIEELGEKSRKILDDNSQSELLTFNNVIPMYEIVASSLYERSILETDINNKRKLLSDSLVWFKYLEDHNAELPENYAMKKANSYKAIFDTYNSQGERERMDSSVIVGLDNALNIYRDILKKNSNNFLAQIDITEVYLDKEIIKPAKDRSFADVNASYARVKEMKNGNKDLTTSKLSQFSSLRQQMISFGLEG
jgi:serine/threonine-protein kinase